MTKDVERELAKHGKEFHQHVHELAKKSLGGGHDRQHSPSHSPSRSHSHSESHSPTASHQRQPKYPHSLGSADKPIEQGALGASSGKSYDTYSGSNIAKGTLNNPSPLETVLMDMEGFNKRPKGDGFGASDFGHGVPAEKFKNYPHQKDGTISRETGFKALQDQVQFKVNQIGKSSLHQHGFSQMNERQQTAFASFAYNLDISKYEGKGLGDSLRKGNLDAVDDQMRHYAKAGKHNVLGGRRNFEADLYQSAEKGVATYKKWKGVDDKSTLGNRINGIGNHFHSASADSHDARHNNITQHAGGIPATSVPHNAVLNNHHAQHTSPPRRG